MGLCSLHNHRNQFLIINLLYFNKYTRIYIQLYIHLPLVLTGSVSLENPDTPSSIIVLTDPLVGSRGLVDGAEKFGGRVMMSLDSTGSDVRLPWFQRSQFFLAV